MSEYPPNASFHRICLTGVISCGDRITSRIKQGVSSLPIYHLPESNILAIYLMPEASNLPIYHLPEASNLTIYHLPEAERILGKLAYPGN
jgi:hypothetical protein